MEEMGRPYGSHCLFKKVSSTHLNRTAFPFSFTRMHKKFLLHVSVKIRGKQHETNATCSPGKIKIHFLQTKELPQVVIYLKRNINEFQEVH
jgi:hypothetical protein